MPEPLDRSRLLPLLTAERLDSYLRVSNNVNDAIVLYEWNMAAAARVMELTGIVEVVVRNALDRELRQWARAKHPGSVWFDRLPLDSQGRADVDKARSRATQKGRRAEVHGRVIAELTLGFWRYLVESRYLTSLWIPATHSAFPHGAQDLRQRQRQVKSSLQQLHFVRNRAAHHEPIHSRDLARDFARAIELLGWVSSDAEQWARTTSSLPEIIRRKP